MIVIAFIALISLLIAHHWIKNRRYYELGQKFSGPLAFPIIGNAYLLNKIKLKDLMRLFEEMSTKYGGIYRLWMGPQLGVIINDVKYVEAILSNVRYISKGQFYGFLKPWLGDGLLVSSGDKWHHRRKIITPTFHFQILEQFVEIFDRESKIMIEKLTNAKVNISNGSIDLFPILILHALDVISETAMGTKINAQTDTESEYTKAVLGISRLMSRRGMSIWLRNNFIFNHFSSMKDEQDKLLRTLHDFTGNIIRKRRDELLRSRNVDGVGGVGVGNKEAVSDEFYGRRKMAFLDLLLQATDPDGNSLTDADIQEEVDTFMFEGHDTTTEANSFILYCLSRHADVQQKVYDEIQMVFGDDRDRAITHRDLQQLKYMEAVIKETLRLYPPVPIISRRAQSEIQLLDKTIPAGANITICLYQTLRDPRHFTRPNDFWPERFLAGVHDEGRNPYAFVPFSAGPRNCIGQKFAMLEMKTTVSKVLRHFELLPLGPEPSVTFELLLRSENGIHVGLRQR